MTLPSSGVIKASMIQAELGESGSWSINSQSSRALAKVPTGTIKFSDFYGKSSAILSTPVKWEQGTAWHEHNGTRNSTECVITPSGQSYLIIGVNSDKFVAHRHNRSGSGTDDIWQSDQGYSYTGIRYYAIRQGQCQTRTLVPKEINSGSIDDLKSCEICVQVPLANIGTSEVTIWDKYETQQTNLNFKIRILAIKDASGNIKCWVRRILTHLGGDNTCICNLAHWMQIGLSNSALNLYYKLREFIFSNILREVI